MATISFIDPHVKLMPDQTKKITSTQVETHDDGSKTFRIMFGKEKISFDNEEYEFIKNAVIMDMESNNPDSEMDFEICTKCGNSVPFHDIDPMDGECMNCLFENEEE